MLELGLEVILLLVEADNGAVIGVSGAAVIIGLLSQRLEGLEVLVKGGVFSTFAEGN
jgi:hypothetical protein